MLIMDSVADIGSFWVVLKLLLVYWNLQDEELKKKNFLSQETTITQPKNVQLPCNFNCSVYTMFSKNS